MIEELTLVPPLGPVCELPVALDATVATCTLEPDKTTVSWSVVVSSELSAELLKADPAVTVPTAPNIT